MAPRKRKLMVGLITTSLSPTNGYRGFMQIMRTVASLPTRAVKKLGSKAVQTLLPERGKRILFMSTLFLSLTRNREGLTSDRLRALNDTLKLVSDTEALRTSEEIYSKVWDYKELETCMEGVCTKPDETFWDRIVSLSPKCIRYDREGMINDIRSVWNLSQHV